MGRPTGRQVFCSFGPQFGNNAPTSDNGQPITLQEFRGKCAVYWHSACLILGAASAATVLAACEKPAETMVTTVEPAAPNHACGENGFVKTTLYGAISTELDWTAADLTCEGMPRPAGEGARLRFAGRDGERQIAIIIALPALQRGEIGTELSSNVTLIEEGIGRFFSTPDLDNCWTDVTSSVALDEGASQYAIGGTLYCVQPLAEVNGLSSVSIAEMQFRGLIDWGAT